MASHQWIDLTDQGGGYGATVLTDCKNASDKPNDQTLRLTLIRTPGTRGGYHDQGTQDIGHHDIVFGLAGHSNDWRAGQTDWQAYRLNDPLVAFEATKHSGSLGKQFSLVHLNNPRIRVLALKKAEQGDEIVLRMVEMDGKPAEDVHITFASPVLAAREINVTSFTANQPRSFALRLGPAPKKVSAPAFAAVKLPYDTSVVSTHNRPADGCFDCVFDRPTTPQGRALAAEIVPAKIDYAGLTFTMAPKTEKLNAVTAHGQAIDLPAGNFRRLYLLAAAANGDHKASFKVGDKSTDLNIQEWTGFVGQWDTRVWKAAEENRSTRQGDVPPDPRRPNVYINPYGEMVGMLPGYIKRADIGWFASHRHNSGAMDDAYAYAYLFVYPIDVPAGAKTLTLPHNPNIRILAATVSNQSAQAWPAQPLYDVIQPSKEAATQ